MPPATCSGLSLDNLSIALTNKVTDAAIANTDTTLTPCEKLLNELWILLMNSLNPDAAFSLPPPMKPDTFSLISSRVSVKLLNVLRKP